MGDQRATAEIDVRDGEEGEIDLRERLRFAAGSLAADFGDQLTTDHAEALVFSSAESLLAKASVMEFVPILAERRARLAFRAGGSEPSVHTAPPAAATARPAPPTGSVGVTPLVAVPETAVSRLRGQVDQTRDRLADWRAELDNR